MAVVTPVPCPAQAGKFLSFVLGAQEFGLEILKVQEITSMMGIVRVPHTPECMRGVVNLRGRVIPTVSLRRKLNLPEVVDTEKTCIVVVQMPHRDTEQAIGLVVDEVADILDIQAEQIDPAPAFGGGMEETDHIIGLGKFDDRIVVLLDIDDVLDSDEMDSIIQAIHMGDAFRAPVVSRKESDRSKHHRYDGHQP